MHALAALYSALCGMGFDGSPHFHFFPRNSASAPPVMLLSSLMFMMWRLLSGTLSAARSLMAKAAAASSRVMHVEPYPMQRARSDSR